jgi:hypothetical protein
MPYAPKVEATGNNNIIIIIIMQFLSFHALYMSRLSHLHFVTHNMNEEHKSWSF